MSIRVQVFVRTRAFISHREVPKGRAAGLYGRCMFCLLGIAELFPKVIVLPPTPPPGFCPPRFSGWGPVNQPDKRQINQTETVYEHRLLHIPMGETVTSNSKGWLERTNGSCILTKNNTFAGKWQDEERGSKPWRQNVRGERQGETNGVDRVPLGTFAVSFPWVPSLGWQESRVVSGD